MNENKILFKTVKHFFPEMRAWIKGMKEPRKYEKQITYSKVVMFWVGICLFLLKLGARRQINYKLKTAQMLQNISMIAKEVVTTMMYDGALAYFMKKIETTELEGIRFMMLSRLLRMRCLEKFRVFGYYLIGIDLTGFLSFNYQHCEHCLTKKNKDGKILYWYHPVVEAKLICANGMVLSIATEFVENPSQKVKRQDCEIKAVYRLEEKLKKYFPQLNICLLLDGLYPKKKVFDFCKKNHWKYIITFKEGAMRAIFAEYITLRSLGKEDCAKTNKKGIVQEYRWVNGIEYKGLFLNVLECEETTKKKDEAGKTIEKKTKFIWLTNFEITRDNYDLLANKGGRKRWKIENEGFNMQKNGGYALEHCYCQNLKAAKNFYLLLQIAHIINQLMELGSLLKGDVKKIYGSIKNFTAALLDSLRNSVIDLSEFRAIETSAFQIRLRGPTS